MINTCQNNAQQHYKPATKQTYEKEIKQLLMEELGFLNKSKLLELLSKEIKEKTERYYKKELSPGQIIVAVPDKRDKPRYGQTIEKTRLVPVKLTITNDEDMKRYAENKKSKEIQRERLKRMAKEAVEQGGLLSQAMASILLGVKQTTITNYVRQQYEETSELIPLRGNQQDIGRSTTHKRWIIELYFEGNTTKQIKEKTGHSIFSIDRYIKAYESIVTVIEELKTYDSIKISRLTGKSQSLVKEFLAMYIERKRTGKLTKIETYFEIAKKTQEELQKTL